MDLKKNENMLLAVDIGNTNVVIGLHDGDRWVHNFRIPTLVEESILFYKMKIVNYFLEKGILLEEINKSVLSSVVPSLKSTFENILL